MHKGLKRNFQLMAGAQWLEMLCRRIPDRFEHLVRYAGWDSNCSRGKRRLGGGNRDETRITPACKAMLGRARSTWARLIYKVYEVDPFECPKCKGPMRVIALIEDTEVIRRILEHLGLWNPRPVPGRGPPGGAKVAEALQLTYHPVPDIA